MNGAAGSRCRSAHYCAHLAPSRPTTVEESFHNDEAEICRLERPACVQTRPRDAGVGQRHRRRRRCRAARGLRRSRWNPDRHVAGLRRGSRATGARRGARRCRSAPRTDRQQRRRNLDSRRSLTDRLFTTRPARSARRNARRARHRPPRPSPTARATSTCGRSLPGIRTLRSTRLPRRSTMPSPAARPATSVRADTWDGSSLPPPVPPERVASSRRRRNTRCSRAASRTNYCLQPTTTVWGCWLPCRWQAVF